MFEKYRNRIDSYTPEQRAEIGKRAAVGLLGLILGLFIGWVVWPVTWTDATLDNLTPELRARYLSAVADAYVAGGGQDAEAALARLSEFRNPEQTLADAIRYYQESGRADAPIRQVNLRTLATALGVDEAVTQALRREAAPETISPTVREPAVGWLNWLLVLLTAILLVGGGIWIGIQSMRRRMDAPRSVVDEDEAMEDEPAFQRQEMSQEQRLAAWQVTTDAKDEQSRAGATVPRSAVVIEPKPTSSYTPTPPVVLEVDTDVEEEATEEVEDGWEADELYVVESHLEPGEQLAAETGWYEDDDEHDDEDDDEGEDVDEWREEGQEREEPGETLIFSTPDVSPPEVEEREEIPPSRTERKRKKDVAEKDVHSEAAAPAEPPPLPPIIPPSDRQADAGRDKTRKKSSRPGAEPANAAPFQHMINNFWRKEPDQRQEEVVAEFTAHYRHGIPDYDESFIITAPGNEGELLGACGMGTSIELDPRSANTDEVRVLDVWFYDRGDFRSYNQLVVSRGSNVDALAAQFPSSGTVTGEPLVAEPGVNFKLTGKDLHVLCQVDEVAYQEKGEDPVPLQSVKVHLKVQRNHSQH